MTHRLFPTAATIAAIAIIPGVACAQGLDRRMAAATGEQVQFHFAARPGTCGDGRNFVRIDGDSWYGTINDATRTSECANGPVRVLVTRAGREVIRLESFVGPLATTDGVTDLGRVAAADAVAWLGSLARSGEGRLARDAMLPLGVADSANASAVFLAIVRDAEQGREARRSALSWLVRRRGAADAMAPGELVAVAARLARDDNEPSALRQSALGQLSRLEPGGGVATLVEMANGTTDGWLARQAAEALGRQGDPRARQFLRDVVGDTRRPAEVRSAAVQALGNEYGSARDAAAIMAAWPGFTTDPLRDAALGALASLGGSASRQFLLRIVKDEGAAARQRRRAAGLLERVGVPSREVIGLYDGVSDGEVRGQLIELLAQAGTRESIAKLVRIAREDTQPAARRKAISALGRRDDPEVRSALRDLVGP